MAGGLQQKVASDPRQKALCFAYSAAWSLGNEKIDWKREALMMEFEFRDYFERSNKFEMIKC